MTVVLAGKKYGFKHPPEHKRVRLMKRANKIRLAFDVTQDPRLLDEFYRLSLWKWLKYPRGEKAKIEADATPDEFNNAVCRIWRIEAHKVAV